MMPQIFESHIEQLVIELLESQSFDCSLPKMISEETGVTINTRRAKYVFG